MTDLIVAALLGLAFGYSLRRWWNDTRRDPDVGILSARIRAYRDGRRP